jgi:hypothetical protein
MKKHCHRALLAVLLLISTASAQPAQLPKNGVQLGESEKQRWKVGLTVTAPNGPCGGIFGTVPVPTDWPEQSVRIVEEEVTQNVTDVRYRTLDNGVKQMLVRINQLQPLEKATALVTFEVSKSALIAPDNTEQFLIPRRVPRDVRRYLGSSPLIEVRNGKIRALAKELTADKEGAWNTVESMFDWVRANVEYKNGPLKGALAALNDGDGDCEELTSLFVALCRANRIPARTVWIPGHCYPEFYLQDAAGAGHWFPCQAAGSRDFGSMPDFKPILQKGDDFRVPEKRERQRYVAEFLSVKAVRGAGDPQVKFVRELLAD